MLLLREEEEEEAINFGDSVQLLCLVTVSKKKYLP
jgi:hypothetical protein